MDQPTEPPIPAASSFQPPQSTPPRPSPIVTSRSEESGMSAGSSSTAHHPRSPTPVVPPSRLPPPTYPPLATDPPAPSLITRLKARLSSWIPSSKSASPVDLQSTPGQQLTVAHPTRPATAHTAPPQYESLPARMDDLINTAPGDPRRPSRPEQRPRPPAPRRSGGSSETGPTMVNPRPRRRRDSWVPPPPMFGEKETPDTVSKIFFRYGCRSCRRGRHPALC